MRVELEGLALRCYVACLVAPVGTLQLLAARAKARSLAEARAAAVNKLERKTAAEGTRAMAQVEAQAVYDAAVQALENDPGQGKSNGGAAASPAAPTKPRGGKASKKRRGDGDGAAAAGDGEMSDVERLAKRARERLNAAKHAAKEAAKGLEAAQVEAVVAKEMAEAAAEAEAAATAGAAPEVMAAATEIHAMNLEMQELRGKLGLEHTDFELAENELRRSHRQQQELVAAAGAGQLCAAGARAMCLPSHAPP
jgi:hypothetical protein